MVQVGSTVYTWQSFAAGRVSGSDSACTLTIFCADDSDFAAGGTIGSNAVYGRGVPDLVDSRSSSGAHAFMEVVMYMQVVR